MLRLIETESGLWDRFQRDMAALRAAPDAAPLVERWRRASELGASAIGPAHPLGVRDVELASRRDTALGLLLGGDAALDALEHEVVGRGLLAIVADAQGVIVRSRGGGAFSAEVVKTRLVEGACWDEAARGTNAIGTAVAEKHAVAVVGRAHWEAVNHGLFCYAAPVRDPFGDLAAVIDVTGPLGLDQPAIGAAVSSAAAALESVLRARAYASSDVGSNRLVERMLDRCAGPALLVESPGVVRRMNDAAIIELEAAADDLSVERLFGVRYDELVTAALSGPAFFETTRRRFVVEFEPVITGGRVLALLCFLSSPSSPTVFRPRVEAASTRRAKTDESEPHVPSSFTSVLGSDPALARAKQTAARLSRAEVPVLLLAETGTGKELFARAIHEASPRAPGPFVTINCGALAPSLLQSELFGYGPGAFTGALRQGSPGKLAAAHGGTLFLDELAEMPKEAQAMLLRFLEDGSYSRVGEVAARKADVRVVTATCRDLPRLVEEGEFRQDLFFRIHGGCVRLPALRERLDRLELSRALVQSMAGRYGFDRAPELAPSAEAWILDHDWPGNVRELKTALAHALAMVAGESSRAALEREHFPEPLVTRLRERSAEPPTRRKAMRDLAETALARAGGNMSEAARRLGVARSTLYRLLTSSPPSKRRADS
ncbi:Transcriptional activator of acetoin/glycerol metabolism [Labilithrix luteola]|uniref:Transcriptional activator of acetoin/glycerol metabolism n=1 Tax=Labilithrix luteola TaxID=1391654 RepID=A0A0K1Q1E5_9BACT|nr:sigma 54-interacting transcriptional regulator [Labilithrix luteola]AKU99615.1 Transcriptional activator of acetoin/glycerol metabolism [Labilithrix luteola]